MIINRIMKILKKIFSIRVKITKSIIGAIIFAISLWGYTSLNQNYITKLNVPLEIQLPNNRALESEPIENVTLEVKGNGWQLFNLLYFNQSKKCLVDLNNTIMDVGSYQIERNEILKSVLFTNVETIDVIPSSFEINTGAIGEKIVDIIPNFTIETKDGYTLRDEPVIKPDKIKIKGNRKILDEITSWGTERKVFKEINEHFYRKINLSDTLENVIELSHSQVEVVVEIESIASMEYLDLPLRIKGGKLNSNRQISSDKFDIVVSGPISKIEKLNPSNISITLEYSNIISSNKTILVPKVNLPKGINLNTINPKYIYSYKIIET